MLNIILPPSCIDHHNPQLFASENYSVICSRHTKNVVISPNEDISKFQSRHTKTFPRILLRLDRFCEEIFY